MIKELLATLLWIVSIKVLNKLFLHLIYFKGLGGEVVGDGGGLLARDDTDGALDGDDTLWLVEGVLCVQNTPFQARCVQSQYQGYNVKLEQKDSYLPKKL